MFLSLLGFMDIFHKGRKMGTIGKGGHSGMLSEHPNKVGGIFDANCKANVQNTPVCAAQKMARFCYTNIQQIFTRRTTVIKSKVFV